MKRIFLLFSIILNLGLTYDNTENLPDIAPDSILVFTYDNGKYGIEVVCPETCDNSYPQEEEDSDTSVSLSPELKNLIEELSRQY
jgi:hypothetical protein